LDDPDIKGQVKLIYIDPPFATRQEFRGSQDQKAYQDKIAGSQFVEFLRKRLIFLRELLFDDGTLVVHLDWRKNHYIKVILDEVFGENNFTNNIVVSRGRRKNLQTQFDRISSLGTEHDVLLLYKKSSLTQFNIPLSKIRASKEQWQSFWRGNFERPTMQYELLGWKPDRGQFLWSKERAYKAVENYKKFEESGVKNLLEYWKQNGGSLEFISWIHNHKYPEYWIPPKTEGIIGDVWLDIQGYSYSNSYPTEKHEELLKRVIEIGSNYGDIVIDAFAGSGTTLAVAEKLGRRWIGIDCGKLAIYTIQKRMLNLKTEIGNKGKPLKPKPFTLYHAGLYDFPRLKKLPWRDWRLFALHLFNCRDNKHTVSGIELDGYKGRSDVLVFNYQQEGE
jgi:Adenine specific DNA methylase Mod